MLEILIVLAVLGLTIGHYLDILFKKVDKE